MKTTIHRLRLLVALVASCTFISLPASAQRGAGVPVPQDIAPVNAPFSMPQPSRPVFPDWSFDIRDFGAVEGGRVKNTSAIREAIQAAVKVGGGTIIVPAGKWLTGAIHLDNNINLHLAAGAELLFSQEFDDYLPAVFSRHEDTECYKFSAFIYANGKTNIAITGEGTLNGQGKPWWRMKQENKDSETRLVQMGNNDVPVEQRVFDGTNNNYLRPAFFQPMRCKNILVEGVTFLYGAFWTITPTYCENVIVRNIRIETEGEYGHTPNGDGVDPSSSRNVLIEYCEFDTGDDCIAIKAGRDQDGLRVGLPTENVVVRYCRGLRGHGGIVIGSETSGGIRNIFAHDCSFTGTDRIVRLKTARGRGGTLENMWFRSLKGDQIALEAIRLNMLYTGTRFPAQPVTNATPRMQNIHFDSISCSSGKGYAVEMLGLPEMPIHKITLNRLRMSTAKGVACTDVKEVCFSHVSVSPGAWPAVSLTDVDSVMFEAVSVPQGADPLLRVDGPNSKGISISGTDTTKAARVLLLGPDVSPDVVKFTKVK